MTKYICGCVRGCIIVGGGGGGGGGGPGTTNWGGYIANGIGCE